MEETCDILATQNSEPPNDGLQVNAQVVSQLLMPHKVDSAVAIMNNQTCRGVLSVVNLLGAAGRKTQAARAILGKRLKEEKFKDFKEAIEKSEANIESLQNGNDDLARFSKEMVDHLPMLMDLAGQIKKKAWRKSGPLGLHSVEKDEVNVKYDKIVQESLDELPATSQKNCYQEVVKIYKESNALFNEVLMNLDGSDTYVALRDKLKRAEIDLQTCSDAEGEAHKSMVEAEKNLKKHTIRVASASEAAGDADSSGQAQMRSLEASLANLKAQMQEIENRLRRYTYNMYDRFTSMWTNDVKLATDERDAKKREISCVEAKIDELRQTLDRCKLQNNDLQTQRKVELAEASKDFDIAKEAHDAAERASADAAAKVRTLTDEMCDLAERNGVADASQIEFIKNMVMSVHEDNKRIRSLVNTSSTDPFSSIRKTMKTLVTEMKEAETLKEQSDLLTDFVTNLKNGVDRSDDGGRQAAHALLFMYSAVDPDQLARFAVGDLPAQKRHVTAALETSLRESGTNSRAALMAPSVD